MVKTNVHPMRMSAPIVSSLSTALLGQSFRILLSRPERHQAERPFDHPDVQWLECGLDSDCLRIVARERPDLVLIKPGGMVGTAVQLCRSLRSDEQTKAVRIAIWHAHLAEVERLDFYRAGADDVVVDEEIGSESIMRLTSDARRSLLEKPHFSYADLILFPERHLAWRRGKSIPLSRFQVQLLQFMLNNPGMVFSKSVLAAGVWNDDPVHDGSISTAVNRLRHLLSIPGAPDLIHTVRGSGYILQSQ